MNLLHLEQSPYLRQHATNPVHWKPWGEEAFDLAKKDNKPILVSIGYSACHWCHVMEHESFADSAIAAFMNQHFICIKVDREERPDVDHFYMEAVQMITGAGGWPLNCFLTPEKIPFFGGTYFPPVNRYGRPSWLQILERVRQMYHEHPGWIKDQSERLLSAIRDQSAYLVSTEGQNEPDAHPHLDLAAHQLLRQLDKEFGGLGQAPKFPQCGSWQYLMAYYHFTGKTEALEAVEHTIQQMYRGGIYDHLGGGFARYATDREWKVPHFEKMLYDNAQLVMVLANLYKITGKPLYRMIGQETLACIERDFTSPEGGFYAAYDADSEGEEGRYYVWSWGELESVLQEDIHWFKDLYHLLPEGNWEGENILYLSAHTLLDKEGPVLPEGIHKEQWTAVKNKLLSVRKARVSPGLDDKFILGWNALQVQAYALAYQAWKADDYLQKAQKSLAFIQRKFFNPMTGKCTHLPQDYPQMITAFLDDYALYIQALLDVYTCTFDINYVETAHSLIGVVLEDFYDHDSGLFYDQAADQRHLPVPIQTLTDQNTPSGPATMVQCLYRLFYLTGDLQYAEIGRRVLNHILPTIGKYPAAFGHFGLTWLNEVYGWKEVAVLGPGYEDQAQELYPHFLPEMVLMGANEPQLKYPLLDKPGLNGINIYFCQNFSCQKPVTNVKELIALF